VAWLFSTVFTSNGDAILLQTESTALGNYPFELVYQRLGDPAGGYRTVSITMLTATGIPKR